MCKPETFAKTCEMDDNVHENAWRHSRIADDQQHETIRRPHKSLGRDWCELEHEVAAVRRYRLGCEGVSARNHANVPMRPANRTERSA